MILPNYYLLSESLIASLAAGGLWCQSSTSNRNGTWYEPSGRPIVSSSTGSLPLQAVTSDGQVGLIRNVGQEISEGLYKCVISDENGHHHELFVAIFMESNYNNPGII